MSTYKHPERLNPRDALFGGRTNAFKLYHKAAEGEVIRYVDFTSLYPFCQATKCFPIGHPQIIFKDFGNLENYYGLIKATVLPPRKLLHPTLPVRLSGKLIFPLCRSCAEQQNQMLPCMHTDEERAIHGCWVSIELLKAIEKGYVVVRVDEVWHFPQRSETLFCDYVKTFLQFKQESSGFPKDVVTDGDKESYVRDYFEREGIKLNLDKIELNPARRSIMKLILNSLWGRFCLREGLPTTEIVKDPEQFARHIFGTEHEIRYFSFVSDAVAIVQWSYANGKAPPTRDVNVFLGAFTTAHARLELYDVMERLGDRLLYCDTDSLIYTAKDGEYEPPLGPYLGDLTDEVGPGDHITLFSSAGPKSYGYVTAKGKVCMKVKGITLNAVNSEVITLDSLIGLVDHYVTERDNSLHVLAHNDTIVRNKKNLTLHNKSFVKKFKVVYDKRVLLPDFITVTNEAPASHHPSSSHPIRTLFPILDLPRLPDLDCYFVFDSAACPDLSACLLDSVYCRLPLPFTPVIWITTLIAPKTSPDQDPAAIAQLSSVLSAQANQLALHQQQLERLTSLTGELVKALQTLTPTPPATAVTPSPVSPPTPQPATVSPRLAFPDKFDGSPSKCKGFLLQCSIFVNQQPALYPTDTSKISFVCSLLTGKALDWATAVWGTDGSVFPTFNYFLQRFREVFDHPSGGKNAGEQLLALSQGSSTAAEYALNFRTLAAQTTWVEDTLKLLFRRGLNTDLQTELACRDEGRGLEEFIELAIHIDNLIRSRRPSRFNTLNLPSISPPNTHSEPMQLGFTRLTTEERERRIRLHLCLSGHPGITATLHLLKNRFWWPTINQDTQAFVKNCTVCNTCKPSRQLPAGLLQPLPIPQRPWSHIAIDFVTDLPNSQGKTTILTVVDRFTNSCRLIPLPKLPTALETAETLCNFVFRFYGLPEDILSDRGPQFTSRVWAAFFSLLNVNISLTSGYHPQANGQTERLNQELTRFLRTYCHSHQADWSRYLMWAEYAQNSILKPATGLTPFKCVLGYQPPLFPWSGEPSELPSVNEWLQRSEETWNRAHILLQRAVRHQVEQANRHRRPNPEYTPGQWVWLSTRDLRLRLPSRKLSPRYVGPFKILRQITPVSFRLELPSNYRISPTFHVSLLKPAEGPGETTEEEEGAEVQTPPPILVDGEEAYQVRDLLDSRRRGGVLQYLVDWEGYGPEERSWVNARDILDPTLKEAFHQAHPEKPAPRPRGRPRRQQPSRFRSRSQGGGSVTNEAPASHHPSSSHPIRTLFPMCPMPRTDLLPLAYHPLPIKRPVSC
ncbi:hypothetical protein M9458_053088 [Cirrhinus mrigala]|uniref:DNA-directed DNA polymerase n=1 Tax=Cirrhinus mrigala TaxID=683832 RepID=A0ABD0MRH9_CIRMR